MATELIDKIEEAPPTEDNTRHAGRKGGAQIGEMITAYCGVIFPKRESGTPKQALEVITCQECIFKVKNIYRL